MVDEFDEISNRGRRWWIAALIVNVALLGMLGAAGYILMSRSGVVTVLSIVASRTIRVSAEHRGKIKTLYVGETQEFKKGDRLFDLEDLLVDSRIAEAEKTVKTYEQQIAEQESELAQRLREFDPRMKIETARQQIKEKQVAGKNLESLLEAAKRRVALKEEALRTAEELFTSGVITRARLDSYRLDCETERMARDKLLNEKRVLETEIGGLEKQITSYQAMIADLTRSTAEQERVLRDKLSLAKSDLANLQSEKELLFCKAKMNGFVVLRVRNEGEVVASGDAVFEATSGDELWVEAYFRPEDANFARVGDQLTVRYDPQTFAAKVQSIGLITRPFPVQRSPIMLPNENYIVVRLDFERPEQAKQAGLRPGMQVTTEMTRPEGLLYRLGVRRTREDVQVQATARGKT